METTIEKTCKILTLVSVLAGIAMASLVTFGVAMRYFFGAPLAFSDELVGLLFVLAAFAILPSCELQNRNISVTLVVDMMSPPLKGISRIARQILLIIFAAVFAVLSIDFAMTSAQFDARMETLNLSIVPWILIIPIAAILVGIIALIRIFRPNFRATDEGAGGFE